MTMPNPQPRCKNLVLDAGPLLSLSPLRGLASTYLTVPQVLAELKDKRAREHFERLGLSAGVNIQVREPSTASLAQAIQWAKKTGDYAVLSHADLCVIALTHQIHEQEKADAARKAAEATAQPEPSTDISASASAEEGPSTEADISAQMQDLTMEESQQDSEDQPAKVDEEIEHSDGEEDLEPLNVELHPINDEADQSNPAPSNDTPEESPITPDAEPAPLFEDPSDDDDGEGEWITPANVGMHKSRALNLLPSDGRAKGKGRKAQDEFVAAGCMTADFALQNVILQMGLNLVGTEGKRIEKVKSWVLRCHACFKICKDSSKQFCPSCGNPSLIRASVTISSPTAASDAPTMQVHLKANFQYRIRGTKYSIPAPKPGSAKTGSGEGLILREDQTDYVKARQRAEGKRQREEKKIMKGVFDKGVDGGMTGVGSWMDPDWVPEIISASAGGKGRSSRTGPGDMPTIGYGRKNPNERRRKA
ncbi:hypothetical protein HGRIS_009357 [Hohenbuehelia grisea]|uniref:20S-pre-rRNA D-site endonuclease NOB1 n=1 Tax=Hohenbuehelia grisea TaxID=104357 RepID=A0ABR3J0X7_9AGAR